ncbi:neprilysin-4 [Calliphora vicina]|uniref:neprilysin-4 n=1 Tax=Calliphora vicina TaxID=7373 RepID=UPI00325BF75B
MTIFKIFQIIILSFVGASLINGTPVPINQTNPMHIEQIRYAKVAEMHNYINTSADPCENFYDFACGNWQKINPANSQEHITTGFFETMIKALDRKIAIMLRKAEEWDNDIDKKVKNFYESCTRLGVLKNMYKSKIEEIASEFGQVPALTGDQWQEDEFDWIEVIGKIAYKYGSSIILGYDIMGDFRNNSVNRIYVGHPDFPLESKSMYVNDENAVYRRSYQNHISGDLQLFWGLNKEKSDVVAKQILEVEVALASGIADEKMGLQLDELTSLTTLSELQTKYKSQLDFVKLLNISLGTLPSLTDPLYEMFSEYQLNLIQIIEDTPKEHLANYIYYTLLKEFMLRMPKRKDELESKCISTTKKYFAKNLDNMVYRKYNTNQTEQDVKLMWDEIKFNFKNLLQSQQLDWISEKTRKYAEEKLEAMKLEINSYANENFTEEFGELVMNKHDYIENLKNILMLNAKNGRKALYEPPKPLEAGELLSYTPANIIVENRIKVPVSLLQPYYLWSTFYPHALKFGTLGTLISHELIHGFDDTGRTFDKAGNNIEWWDDKSTEAFNERSKCFVNQYKQYIYGGKPLPEMASQSENIADNGGLHLAYEAYLYWHEHAVRNNQPMLYETLPRLNYTSKQLFFISYAQLWCSDAHPAVRSLQTAIDSHVPGKFRVIGPLSNFKEFSKEFNCPSGSGMNPVDKCFIY